jgi:glycerol-3-phosphate dehydrogenase subunit C
MVCPNGVKIAEINARARARMVEDGRIPPLLRLRNNLVARSAALARLAQPIHPLSNFIFSFAPARILADRLLHIARHAPFPRFASQRFTSWFRQQPHHPGENGRVVYFHGCATEFYEPWIGKAVVRVLEASGLEVMYRPELLWTAALNGEFRQLTATMPATSAAW